MWFEGGGEKGREGERERLGERERETREVNDRIQKRRRESNELKS